jgi:hypothetical protein
MYSFGEGVRGEELKTFTNYYTPGPGTYDQVDQEAVMDGYPTWKVGTSKRPHLYGTSNKDVGPGSYEVNKAEMKKYLKKTIGKEKRGQIGHKGISTVGPDAYNPKGFARIPPSYSFGYKTDGFADGKREDVPGPGAYEIKNGFEQPEENMRQTKSAFNRTAPQALSKSRDPKSGSSGLPGPGYHYNPEVDNYDFRFFNPTWSFGKATRDDLYNDEAKNLPGPGKYNMAGTVNMKTGYTILGKNYGKKANISDTPGPNVYNQEVTPLRQTAPAFRIGKAARKDMSTGNPEFPGPGAYHKYNYVAEKGTRMGTSVRPGLYNSESKKTPGPGEYEVRGDITKSIKYSMGVKTVLKKQGEVFPGPGEYEPFGSMYLDINNGAIIGTSERPALYKKGMAPGPGQYDTRGNIGIGTKSKIGNGKRPPMTKVTDEPGPGYYNIPSAIANVQKYLLPYYSQEKRKNNGEADTSFKGIFGGLPE